MTFGDLTLNRSFSGARDERFSFVLEMSYLFLGTRGSLPLG